MDDITFCLSECKQTDCFRHPSNIQDRTIPHSYADFRETDTCPSRQLIEKMQLSEEDATKDATFDCISRRAVIDKTKSMFAAAKKWYGEAEDDEIKARAESCMMTNVEIKLWVEKLPSVQPQRMRRGYWKSDDSVCTIKQFECSVCEELVEVPMILNEIQWHFCPHCGAKMGGQDETRGISETP